MSSLPRIALAGATGYLGLPILSALLSAKYRVTVLTRVGGNRSKLTAHPYLTIKEVDFTSVPDLSAALENVQVVVSCLATLAMGSQNPLIDAAVATGVKRFVPAEFGMDSQNPQAMQLPVCVPKVDTRNYLREQSRANVGFTWTGIANGMFLDWGLRVGVIVDPAKHSAVLYNGGDVPFSATTLEDVTKAVLGVIRNLDQTANRLVYVHSAIVTQNRLIQYAKDKDGEDWAVITKDTSTIERESIEELEKGSGADMDSAMLGFCITAMFDTKFGCDFSSRLENELVGLKAMSETEVRKVVEDCLLPK